MLQRLCSMLLLWTRLIAGEDDTFFRCDYRYDEDGGGWFNLVEIPTIFHDAVTRCNNEGAILASPLTSLMLRMMTELIVEYGILSSGLLTGMQRRLNEFVTLEGKLQSELKGFLKWEPDQPDNYKNNENCVFLHDDGKISDERCDKIGPFICFKKAVVVEYNEACGTTNPDYKPITRLDYYAKPTGQLLWPCVRINHETATYQEAFRQCAIDGGRLHIPFTDVGGVLDEKNYYVYDFITYTYLYNQHRDGPGYQRMWIGAASALHTFEHGLYTFIDGTILDIYNPEVGKFIKNYFNDFYYYATFPNPNENQSCINMYPHAIWQPAKFVAYTYPLLGTEDCGVFMQFMCELSNKSLTDCDGFETNPEEVTYKPENDEDIQYRCDYTYFEGGQGWFKLHKIPTNFFDAVRICHMEGAKIATPLFKTRRDILLEIMDQGMIEDPGIWAGMHATIAKGFFFSVDGGHQLRNIKHKWDGEQPDNLGNNQSCLVFRPNGRWSDEYCDDAYPYICYKKVEKIKRVKECLTTDQAYNQGLFLWNCYKSTLILRNWKDAKTACHAEGGYLAVVNNGTELKEMIEEDKKMGYARAQGIPDYFFIGCRQFVYSENDTELRYIDGSTLAEAGFTKTYDLAESCCMISRRDTRYIYTGKCDELRRYLCEKEPDNLMDCFPIKKRRGR